jgi:RNA polymerase sigma factor (TIGR02999 family)
MRQTMTTTALVHESWFKLKDSPHLAGLPHAHFKSIAIRAMRQVLVEEARRRLAHKRDCELLPLTGDIAASPFSPICVELLAMDAAITELADLSERQADVVCRRVFGGETVDEIAEALGISKSSVERDWRIARAWLAVRIRSEHKER